MTSPTVFSAAAFFAACLAFATPAAATAAAVDTGYVEVDGGRLYYERAGSGETIVLIHDGLVHREVWDGQFGAFAERYDVVRYDRRGYGKSPAPAATYSNIDDLAKLFDGLGIERAVLMGMSAGGGLAIDFTLEHPRRVTALVLVGAVVSGFGYTAHMTTRGGHYGPADRASTEAAIEYWAVKDPYETAPGNKGAKERVKALIEANPQDLDDAKHRFASPPRRAALANLGEVAVPALVVVGEYDIPDVHAHAGAIAAGIRGARRFVVPDAGHLVPLEQPAAFNESTLAFLVEEPFFALLEREGVAAAMERWKAVRTADPKAFVFGENRMNITAYRYLASGRVDEAVELFKLNVLAYPGSFNVYDSLGEAYLKRGDRELAVLNYEKSLSLNPENQNAKDVLDTLRAESGGERR